MDSTIIKVREWCLYNKDGVIQTMFLAKTLTKLKEIADKLEQVGLSAPLDYLILSGFTIEFKEIEIKYTSC